MKPVGLFLATNRSVLIVLSAILSVTGANRFLSTSGMDVPRLLIFSMFVGFTGAIISLLISKPMAKWSTGAEVIDTPRNADEEWLLGTVARLADRAGIR